MTNDKMAIFVGYHNSQTDPAMSVMASKVFARGLCRNCAITVIMGSIILISTSVISMPECDIRIAASCLDMTSFLLAFGLDEPVMWSVNTYPGIHFWESLRSGFYTWGPLALPAVEIPLQ